MSRNPDVFHAGVNALAHYNAFGSHEGRDPNAFFDTSGYLAVNRDVAAAGSIRSTTIHQSGWHEGRDPSADFDTTLYLLRNPDVAAAGVDPLEHYLAVRHAPRDARHSRRSGRPSSTASTPQFYLCHNPDVAAAGVDPLAHFNSLRLARGPQSRTPGSIQRAISRTTPTWRRPTSIRSSTTSFGWHEGRDPSVGFDTTGIWRRTPMSHRRCRRDDAAGNALPGLLDTPHASTSLPRATINQLTTLI